MHTTAFFRFVKLGHLYIFWIENSIIYAPKVSIMAFKLSYRYGSILGPILFLLDINDLSDDDVICNVDVYDDDTIFYSNCD